MLPNWKATGFSIFVMVTFIEIVLNLNIRVNLFHQLVLTPAQIRILIKVCGGESFRSTFFYRKFIITNN